MKTLTADEILKAKDFKTEPVEVPEWGGRVFVRQFSAKVREEFDAFLVGDGDGDELNTENLRCRVVALACCDEKGKLLFTAEQAAELAEKSNDAIGRVYDAAAKLNRLRKKDVEIEKKESATPPTADSPTG